MAGHEADGARRAGTRRPVLAAVLAATCAVVLVLVVGGYGFGWGWTGLSRAVTLWDWLQALLLPIALGVAPILLLHRRHLGPRHRLGLGTGAVLFAALVTAGYLVPLTWTGFAGNTLWDWLELALLPLVIATASLWAGTRPRGLGLGLAAAGLAVLLVLVVAGYAVPLTWTGFTGNTAWDWVKLLLLPVLLPTVVVPQLADRLEEALAARRKAAEREVPERAAHRAAEPTR